MSRWFETQMKEIQSRWELRWYGSFLGLTHVLTIFFWHFGATLKHHLTDPIAICWVFLPHCEVVRPFLQIVFGPLFFIYGVLTIASVVLWFWAAGVRAAYWSLTAATVLKVLFYFIDYREMGNYHYMPHLAIAVFLLIPNKIETLRFLIVAFYLGAGVLKFNVEWLSGSAIFGHPWLKESALVVGCFGVVLLEMIGSLGLLSRQKWVFGGALVGFAAFHLFSWHLVGFFYPLVMFCLLSIFVLAWIGHRQSDRPLLDIADLRKLPPSTIAVLAVFATMQAPPFFAKTDSAITGELRLTSLNMFDARSRCNSHVWIHRQEDGKPVTIDLQNPLNDLGIRIHCEPWVYREYVRSLCALGPRDPGFRDIDIDLTARRSSARRETVLLHQAQVCTHLPLFQ